MFVKQTGGQPGQPTSAAANPTHPGPAGPPIRVFLAEDHAITLWGLQRLIDSQAQQMTVVGTAQTSDALLANPTLAQAQVLVMDLDLADRDGLDALPDVQRISTAQVLVLTASEDIERHYRAVELGARGVLHKSEAPQQIITAIQQVHAGAAWLSPQLMGRLLRRLTQQPENRASMQDPLQTRIASLTSRERHIVRILSQNASEKLIGLASLLGMSENTLRNHLTAVYSKLGVRGRLELHVFASEHGLMGD